MRRSSVFYPPRTLYILTWTGPTGRQTVIPAITQTIYLHSATLSEKRCNCWLNVQWLSLKQSHVMRRLDYRTKRKNQTIFIFSRFHQMNNQFLNKNIRCICLCKMLENVKRIEFYQRAHSNIEDHDFILCFTFFWTILTCTIVCYKLNRKTVCL